jgi:hypothetical protein
MSSLQWNAINSIGAVVGVALILSNLAVAQAQTIATQMDQPNRVSVAYVAPKNPVRTSRAAPEENVDLASLMIHHLDAPNFRGLSGE